MLVGLWLAAVIFVDEVRRWRWRRPRLAGMVAPVWPELVARVLGPDRGRLGPSLEQGTRRGSRSLA